MVASYDVIGCSLDLLIGVVQMCACTHKNSCLVSITVGIHTLQKFEHPEYIGSSQKIETGISPFLSFISQIR